MRKSKPFDIKRDFYSMASVDGESAEIQLYGDVVETRPIDWRTEEPIEGNFIMQDEFLEDLKTVSKCKKVSIRINSYGGDSAVGILIHNKLRELSLAGVETTCYIDAVAMSAATIIASACDHVVASASSLFMIHKCWAFMWGGYNADELRQLASSHDAYDKAYASAYARKTGLSEVQLLHMMSDTTYMTGKEAMEKGFVNELLEDDVQLAASADGRVIYSGNRTIHLCPGMFAPDNIPTITVSADAVANAPDDIDNEPVAQAEDTQKEETTMTLAELREQYPELVSQIESEAVATVDNTEAVNAAVQAEQKRLAEIDEVASLFDTEMVSAAKYGENACSASELAYRAAKRAAEQGREFLSSVKADAEESNAEEVEPAAAPEEAPKSEEQVQEEIKSLVKGLLK